MQTALMALKEVVETTAQRRAGSMGLDLVPCCIGYGRSFVSDGGFPFRFNHFQIWVDRFSHLNRLDIVHYNLEF